MRDKLQSNDGKLLLWRVLGNPRELCPRLATGHLGGTSLWVNVSLLLPSGELVELWHKGMGSKPTDGGKDTQNPRRRAQATAKRLGSCGSVARTKLLPEGNMLANGSFCVRLQDHVLIVTCKGLYRRFNRLYCTILGGELRLEIATKL
ncbi:MAG TPA: hypothetical protein VFO38_04435 [Candidatus Saccharimonadales bacterium]|nr:hypothetical protein [Candidatus Saccharimonadales bacterium]